MRSGDYSPVSLLLKVSHLHRLMICRWLLFSHNFQTSSICEVICWNLKTVGPGVEYKGFTAFFTDFSLHCARPEDYKANAVTIANVFLFISFCFSFQLCRSFLHFPPQNFSYHYRLHLIPEVWLPQMLVTLVYF
jgi:hypothetical protein